MVRCRVSRPVIGSLTVEGLRERLTLERIVGTVVSLPDVGLAELSASAVDLVWIDLEHGAVCQRDVQPLTIAAHSAGAASLVRLRAAGDVALGAALDSGVDGVVVPRVERAADAEALLARLRYPPRGSRGLAARRASRYGARPAGRADPILMAQVESVAGVESAGAIAAVDGVDAVIVGCADLALDLGEDPAAPSGALRDAIAHVHEACARAGTASGVAGPDDPRRLVELAGGRPGVLVLGADVRMYARALRAAVARLKDKPEPTAPEPEEAHVAT